MNGVIGRDEEFGSSPGQLVGRGKHEVSDALPVIPIDKLHVLGKTVGVHAHLRMLVAAHQGGRFTTDGAIAQRRAFGTAGDNSDMLWHGDSSQNFPSISRLVVSGRNEARNEFFASSRSSASVKQNTCCAI